MKSFLLVVRAMQHLNRLPETLKEFIVNRKRYYNRAPELLINLFKTLVKERTIKIRLGVIILILALPILINWPTARVDAGPDQHERTVYVNSFGAKCDGIHDDAEGIRAAIRAAIAIGGASVHFAPCKNNYLLLSTDPTGLGAIVVGDGVDPDTVSLIGESYGVDLADKTFKGRVRLYLGDKMNVPVIYYRKNAAIASVRDIEIDGNRSHQQAAITQLCGNGLYILCVEDDLNPVRESGLSLFNVTLIGAANGAYYLGTGRGGVYLQNVWALGGGITSGDALIMLRGYDTIVDNPQISNSSGYGLYFGQGTQYQVTNGAFWNNNVAIGVNSAVNQLSVIGTQIGNSASDGIQTAGPRGGKSIGARSFVNVSFNSNGLEANGFYSDVGVAEGGQVTLIAPDFGGNSSGGPKTSFNCYCNGPKGSCDIRIVAANYTRGESSTFDIVNDIESLRTDSVGEIVSNKVIARDTVRAANGFISGTHSGVSCDQAPTPHFTVVNGIVTRC